jgi:hypothetical protein
MTLGGEGVGLFPRDLVVLGEVLGGLDHPGDVAKAMYGLRSFAPMKSYRKELWFETPGRRAFLNITSQV